MSRHTKSHQHSISAARRHLYVAAALLTTVQIQLGQATVYPSDHQLYKFDYLHPRAEADAIDGVSKRVVSKRENAIPLIVTNNCGDTLWPGVATQGGDGPESSGFELGPGEMRNMTVGPTWAGRVWGRTNCTVSNETATCQTGDCFGKLECDYSVSYKKSTGLHILEINPISGGCSSYPCRIQSCWWNYWTTNLL